MNPHDRLAQALGETSDVYVPDGMDEATYIRELTENLRANLCDPFPLAAVVMAPGLPHVSIGDQISGICLAHRQGYWLIYRDQDDQFYCFWGPSLDELGAHGVFGSPLYCWSA